jgi:hypothetical protein
MITKYLFLDFFHNMYIEIFRFTNKHKYLNKKLLHGNRDLIKVKLCVF